MNQRKMGADHEVITKMVEDKIARRGRLELPQRFRYWFDGISILPSFPDQLRNHLDTAAENGISRHRFNSNARGRINLA